MSCKYITRFFIVFFLTLTACISTPKNPQKEIERQVNACLPAAITMREGLTKSGVWSEVLMVEWTENTKSRGHAFAVYLYPKGKNQLWAYDRDWGSTRVHSFTNNPTDIAIKALWSRNILAVNAKAKYLQ